MVGGIVVQIVDAGSSLLVEVLDQDTMDRCWRFVRGKPDIRIHDKLWWQSRKGYLSRTDAFEDREIGFCGPSSGPVLSAEDQARQQQWVDKPRIIKNPTEPIRNNGEGIALFLLLAFVAALIIGIGILLS